MIPSAVRVAYMHLAVEEESIAQAHNRRARRRIMEAVHDAVHIGHLIDIRDIAKELREPRSSILRVIKPLINSGALVPLIYSRSVYRVEDREAVLSTME